MSVNITPEFLEDDEEDMRVTLTMDDDSEVEYRI